MSTKAKQEKNTPKSSPSRSHNPNDQGKPNMQK
ncbi:hypothetical protein A8990_109107 [Paenibacillus taihuensis]|uniref:Uncharacterized protein n=1 Tax=Paenibacillus taihuensis TaxID=1156355 RepID=A0A3D9SCF3_9BACL|nr:hypothetical protein A8990_109107 [Paenibacillus taihuensis]